MRQTLFTALMISNETLNLLKLPPKLKSLPISMAPCAFVAKSQEVVYKKTGSSARPRFKAVHVKIPKPKKSADIQKAEHTAPSVSLLPDGAEDPSAFGPGESSSYFDYEIPQRKKNVSCAVSWNVLDKMNRFSYRSSLII